MLDQADNAAERAFGVRLKPERQQEKKDDFAVVVPLRLS
jgi:hypothetical protein